MPPTRGGIRRFVEGWGIPIVVAAAALIFVAILPRAIREAVRIGSFGFYWLPLVALWIAAGRNLVSIALWLIPAVSLSVAWLLGATGIGWPITALAVGVLSISFFPPAIELWSAVVSWFSDLVLHVAQSSADRQIDVATERYRQRLWVAAKAATANGPARYLSDLLAIRMAVEDLPTDDVRSAQLRRALLLLVDALHDEARGIDDASAGPAKAIEAYWDALHLYRSRSLLYRILTLRRPTSRS